MRKFEVHSQESEAGHKDFWSIDTFLARVYVKDISQKFPKKNSKFFWKIGKKYVYMEMLLKTKERLYKHKKLNTVRYQRKI